MGKAFVYGIVQRGNILPWKYKSPQTYRGHHNQLPEPIKKNEDKTNYFNQEIENTKNGKDGGNKVGKVVYSYNYM